MQEVFIFKINYPNYPLIDTPLTLTYYSFSNETLYRFDL